MPIPPDAKDSIAMPPPAAKGRMSVEEALAARRSVRQYARQGRVTEHQLSQLLWSAQGLTGREGLRTTPSAGALYPLELYVVMASGMYHYEPHGHRLSRVLDEDPRKALAEASLNQREIADATLTFVLAAVYERVERKYGHARGRRYVDMEVGHAAQNLMLQAAALGLASVPIGAFEDERVSEVLALPSDHEPLYLIPVGRGR